MFNINITGNIVIIKKKTFGEKFFMKNCFKNKKVLITGHTGFKGSWLAQWLTILGSKVTGISLEPNSTPSHYELLDLKSKMKV